MPLYISRSLSALNNLVASIMLLKESVDTDNLRLDMVSLDEGKDKQPD